MNQLTHKNIRFNLSTACDKVFHELKSSLISAPILAYSDFSLLIELHTHASSTGIDFALCQTQAGLNRAIAYGGLDLNAAERNYCTTEREALAIVAGVPIERIRKFPLDDAEPADLIAHLQISKLPTNQNRACSFLVQGNKFYLDENGLLCCLWTPS